MLVRKVDINSINEAIDNLFKLSEKKINLLHNRFDFTKGSPVYTVNGQYVKKGWTEWTEGFVYGIQILNYDATGNIEVLEKAKKNVVNRMSRHVSHFGVHDHGFNNLSTYGNLLRLMNENKIEEEEWERRFYTMAIQQSAAIQVNRWTKIKDGGFVYSFNGPHSLFVDTIRTCRILGLAHQLKHYSQGENDININFLERAIKHLKATARYSVYYGQGRDNFDVKGRVAHESIFNVNDGTYRCPNSQQGFSGFTTWTRGLAWAILGFAEEIEFFSELPEEELEGIANKEELIKELLNPAIATCDFYIKNTASDGIPYWDTGAPGLTNMGNYIENKSDPYNDFEPIDSSAAVIAAQGFLRLSNFFKNNEQVNLAEYYKDAGLTILESLLQFPYISSDELHEGLLLHSVYHWPNKWDNVRTGAKIPNDESSMWGDYHLMELAVYVKRLISGGKYLKFFI